MNVTSSLHRHWLDSHVDKWIILNVVNYKDNGKYSFNLCTRTNNNLNGMCTHKMKWIDKQRSIHFLSFWIIPWQGNQCCIVSNYYCPSIVFYCDWDLFTECVLRVVCLCNHLVLSESMVWNSFSNSSSFRVPSEKKAWNSSRESFPSSAGGREEILAARLIHF